MGTHASGGWWLRMWLRTWQPHFLIIFGYLELSPPHSLATMTQMAPTTATKTKKPAQPSRKGKKAWRKNTDVGDVEEQLDELRNEERLGSVGNSFSVFWFDV